MSIIRFGLACLLAGMFAGPGYAKLPPPSEEQKAKAVEAKAKADEAAKKNAELLGKAQDRVAERYLQQLRAKGIEVKPTPIAVPAPPPAAASAAPAPAAAATK
jgi:hypothetical protein